MNYTNKNEDEGLFSSPTGYFIFLDSQSLVKHFPVLKQSYLVVKKNDRQFHLKVFDHGKNELILSNEVKDILAKVYPEYQELMHETFMEELMDPERVAFGIALGMQVFKTYEEPFIHFRGIYTHAFKNESELNKRYPLGDPHVTLNYHQLNFIYLAFESKDKGRVYVYDGYLFYSPVLEILESTYGIIEPCPEPQEYNGYFTDAWQLKRKL